MSKKSGVSMIRGIMLSGRWWTIPKLQQKINAKFGVYFMSTSISARLRDLRKSKFGGYDVERQRIPNSKLNKYRLVH